VVLFLRIFTSCVGDISASLQNLDLIISIKFVLGELFGPGRGLMSGQLEAVEVSVTEMFALLEDTSTVI
jgi:hypothetical protein